MVCENYGGIGPNLPNDSIPSTNGNMSAEELKKFNQAKEIAAKNAPIFGEHLQNLKPKIDREILSDFIDVQDGKMAAEAFEQKYGIKPTLGNITDFKKQQVMTDMEKQMQELWAQEQDKMKEQVKEDIQKTFGYGAP